MVLKILTLSRWQKNTKIKKFISRKVHSKEKAKDVIVHLLLRSYKHQRWEAQSHQGPSLAWRCASDPLSQTRGPLGSLRRCPAAFSAGDQVEKPLSSKPVYSMLLLSNGVNSTEVHGRARKLLRKLFWQKQCYFGQKGQRVQNKRRLSDSKVYWQEAGRIKWLSGQHMLPFMKKEGWLRGWSQ